MSVKTTDVISRYAHHDDAIVEAGEFANWRFAEGTSLSLPAAKMLHLLIQAAGVRITDDCQHHINYAELNYAKVSIEEMKETVSELQRTLLSLELKHPDGRTYTKSGAVIADVERDHDTGSQAELRYQFSPTMRAAIADSTHWAVISRKAVLAFTSKYALRLYSFIALRANLRRTTEKLMLEDLRRVLGIEKGQYPRFANLRQRCLDDAIAELNQLAGFRVGYRPLKSGRAVVAVELFWGIKDSEQRIEAAKELERTRVGRKARREGQVELVADADQITRHEIALALAETRGKRR